MYILLTAIFRSSRRSVVRTNFIGFQVRSEEDHRQLIKLKYLIKWEQLEQSWFWQQRMGIQQLSKVDQQYFGSCKQFINHLFMFLVETPTTTPGSATTLESPQRRTTPGLRFHPPSPTLLPMLLVFSLKLDQWLAKKWAKLVVMLMRKYVEVVATLGLDQIRFNPLVPLYFNPQ